MLLFGQGIPRRIDIVIEHFKNGAQVFAVPANGPGGDGALTNTQRAIGHQRSAVQFRHHADAVTNRASALRIIRRKRLGGHKRHIRRAFTRAGEKQTQVNRNARHAADG